MDSPFMVLDSGFCGMGRYASKKVAIEKAKQMAEDNGGSDKFYVAAIIGVAQPVKQPVEYTPLRLPSPKKPKRRTPRAKENK